MAIISDQCVDPRLSGILESRQVEGPQPRKDPYANPVGRPS